MRDFIRRALRRTGYDIIRAEPARPVGPAPLPRDVTPEEEAIYRAVKPYTMTGLARVITLIRAVHHVVDNGIEGDFVECGVWRGGSMMAVALALNGRRETTRQLFLFDTFAGMSAPSGRDARYDGAAASDLLAAAAEDSWVRARASVDDVTANVASTGYPMENVHLIRGKVEDTLPQRAPAGICLLRLDTDWYESTMHELTHLYPRLAAGGILIIDDYGHWQGARQATDEYFGRTKPAPFLHRIDYSGRLVVKLSAGPGTVN
jgi:O-methyltransferase